LELLEMLRVGTYLRQWHLVGPERALDLAAVDDFWAGPALRRDEDEHRPARPPQVSGARTLLNPVDRVERLIECRRHLPMHALRLVAWHEQGGVGGAAQNFRTYLAGDAPQTRWVAPLVAV